MSSVNKVILIGKLGRDPESRSFANGGKVCELRVATSEKWSDRTTGEKKEKVEWNTVKVWNEATANFCERYLRKGSEVYVEGSLETRKWQGQDGGDRYSTEVAVRPYNGQVLQLGGRTDQNRGDRNEHANGGGFAGAGAPASPGFDADLDSDVPF
jgi:single-strand DNA-binding protein